MGGELGGAGGGEEEEEVEAEAELGGRKMEGKRAGGGGGWGRMITVRMDEMDVRLTLTPHSCIVKNNWGGVWKKLLYRSYTL